jgi:S1-C subfamily serine protease
VVDIYARFLRTTEAGTGITISPNGVVLTCAHVVAQAKKIEVIDLDLGRAFTAELVGADTRHDVAVLRITAPDSDPTATVGVPVALPPVRVLPPRPATLTPAAATSPSLPAASIGDSELLRIGEPVSAVGNEGGRGGTPSIATGRITALGVPVYAEDDYRKTSRRLRGLIAVSARVQPGDSGGPLFDAQGQVVGMDSSAPDSRSDRDDEAGPATDSVHGYAIPINSALATAYRHGWITANVPGADSGRAAERDREDAPGRSEDRTDHRDDYPDPAGSGSLLSLNVR